MTENFPASVKDKIQNEFDKANGIFAIAFKEISAHGKYLFINETETFHAASTMKTPVMIEAFKQACNGNFSLDDLITIRNEFRSIADNSVYELNMEADGGEDLYRSIGKQQSIYELVYRMITVSSNLAANILVDLVGAANINMTMENIGAANMKILRGVEDIKAFEAGLNNTATALDLMTIFEGIANGNIISKEACEEMIKILSKQKLRNIIPAKLPHNIKIAHKTGSLTGSVHDSGIVFLPDSSKIESRVNPGIHGGRKYVLVLMSKDLTDANKGIEVQANVSKIIYDFML